MSFYSHVVAIEGDPVSTNRDAYDRVASLQVGTPVHYTLVKNGMAFTRLVATMRFTVWHYWLTVGTCYVFGLVSAGAGIIVALLQPRGRAERTFFSQAFFTGILALTATALYQPDLWWLSRVHLVTHALFARAFIHLGLVCPEPRSLVERRPMRIMAPYAVSALLATWMMIDFYRTPPDLTAYHATCGS